MSAPETPERELELIRLAVGNGAFPRFWFTGDMALVSEEGCLTMKPGSRLRRRLVELGRHEEQRTQDAETRRALEEA